MGILRLWQQRGS